MFLLLLTFLCNTAVSMVMIQVESDDMVNKADLILHGEVKGKEAVKNPKGMIFTEYSFKVVKDGAIKSASPSPSMVTLSLIGGKLGKERLEVPGIPELYVGERYVLFLQKRSNNKYDIYAANQGCMRVVVSGDEKAVRPCEASYFNSIYLEYVNKELAPTKTVELSKFIDKIKEYLSKK